MGALARVGVRADAAGAGALLELLDAYVRPEEAAVRDRIRAFVAGEPRCFENDCWAGHITGSAWVLSEDRTHTLLILHRKLARWLQPGGHSDGSPDTRSVALREAREETGIARIALESPAIFDLDIHEIPARGSHPAHLHLDVRFAMRADMREVPAPNDESQDLAWVKLTEVERYTSEESVLRMVRKTIGGVASKNR